MWQEKNEKSQTKPAPDRPSAARFALSTMGGGVILTIDPNMESRLSCRVSVIVPNYNHAPYLERRFDSIFTQTYQDFEVIILDDCSTDNSRDVL